MKLRLLIAALCAIAMTSTFAIDALTPTSVASTRIIIRGKWSKDIAEFYWTSVPGARYYKATAAAGDFIGPICGCSGDRVDVPMWNLPYRAVSSRIKDHGIRIAVTAYDAHQHVIGSSEGIVRSRMVGKLVPIRTKRGAATKIENCLKDGLTAAAGATVEAGAFNVVADWVPGVDIPTAAGSALSIGTAGYAEYIVCLVAP